VRLNETIKITAIVKFLFKGGTIFINV